MIYLYPANKMENLLVLLDKIQQVSPLSVFSQETIVVQNAGMQHWLSLSLAQQRNISMNMRYVLPAQFLWQLIRSLVSESQVPEQSSYSREVLTWRIFSLLASDAVCQDQDFQAATSYWQGTEQAELKRYQLAGQLADLYEQYLIFRPEWIDLWHQGHTNISAVPESNATPELASLVLWQAKLWQLLIQEQPYNPVELIEQALMAIEDNRSLLPSRISFFGINAMAPIWLDFIHALSKHIDIHFFHLNPCYAYWGDILTEKQAINTISDWLNDDNNMADSIGNPLLANLGQQGREFLALLQQYSTVNIDVFDTPPNNTLTDDSSTTTVLADIQQDILTLKDRRQTPIVKLDDSIVVTSCHSALREVQGLHDWLLHRFNQDPQLTPKDVLVMCPQIEDYAPYVNAVFTRGWQDIGDDIPPLPCSIADRTSKDAEPIIAAFIEMLHLPDSRFQVSQLMSLLRLPAMQAKFDISLDELTKISLWLAQASIHWGLDQQHKKHVLKSEQANNSFTWQQGLARLLRGFAYGEPDDQQGVIFQEQLLITSIEGADAILLGKMMLILEQLQQAATALARPRSAIQWQEYLLCLVNELFDIEADHSFQLIYQAIAALVEYCDHANFNDTISLLIVQDFLNNHFSIPDPGRQFMVGQVTFCSMLPMRSIPFKVIAVLGLNDGQFPRQRQPLGFDLMTQTPAKLGDRSRRGDDRYLFLEAIISARQALYLSYQGRNIRTNAEQQASLVLKELQQYLSLGFGWQFITEKNSQLRQLAMQAFSEQNYQGAFQSFDAKWLALNKTDDDLQVPTHTELSLPLAEQCKELLSEQLIAFFQHPAKMFAQQGLKLYFELRDIKLEDAEPFALDHLQSYLLRQQLVAVCLTAQQAEQIVTDSEINARMTQVVYAARLDGKFPDLPTSQLAFDKWQADSLVFSQAIISEQAEHSFDYDCQLTVQIPDHQFIHSAITLTAKFPVHGQQLLFYRSSRAKAKDFFTLYLHQLILQVWQQQALNKHELTVEEQALASVSNSLGLYFDTKSQKVTQYVMKPIVNAQEKLTGLISYFLQGQRQPLLLNTDIAEKMFTAKSFSQTDFEHFWQDANAMRPLGADPYIQYFWPQCPKLSEYEHDLITIYQPLFETMQKIPPARTSTKGKK